MNASSVESIIDELMKEDDGVNPNSRFPVEQQLAAKREDYRRFLELKPFKDRIILAVATIEQEMQTLLPEEEYESLIAELAHAGKILESTPEKQGSELGVTTTTLDKLYEFAHKAMKINRMDEAIAILTLLTTLDRSWFRHWFLLGVALQEQKHYKDALEAYEMANTISEEAPLAHLFSAECYYNLADMQKASAHLHKGKGIAQHQSNNLEWTQIIDELETKIK